MNKKEYIQSLKTKTDEALLNLLKVGQEQDLKTDPDQLNYVIQELDARNLSEIDYLEFKRLVNYFSDLISGASKFEQTKNLIEKVSIKKDKYSDLKFIARFILNLTYFGLLTGAIFCVYIAGELSFFVGAIYFVSLLIGSLFSIAFAKLTFVFKYLDNIINRL